MTLIRTGIRRKPDSVLGQFIVKPAKCKVCKSLILPPSRPTAIVCSGECAASLALSERLKAEKRKAVKAAKLAATDRKDTRAKLDKLKSRAQWAKEAQAAVNKVVRLRDMLAGRGCITCGAQPAQKWGGTMDAGHFRSVGSAPHLRFFTPQIALQCVTCNRYQGGRTLDFRRALVEQYGAAWVDALESRQEMARFDILYLQRLKAVFSKLGRRLEKRLEARSNTHG